MVVEICIEFITQRTTTCFGTLHWQSSGWEMKNLVSSYTRLKWVVYSGEVRGEVGTRSCMWYVGWVVWVHGFCYYMLFEVNIVGSTVSSYFCRDYMYMYT